MSTIDEIRASQNSDMLTLSEAEGWDYRIMSNGYKYGVPKVPGKFGLRMIENSLEGLRDIDAEVDSFKIPFQYIEEFPTWTKQANWENISGIMGRFEDPVVYSNSSAQEMSMTLCYVAEAEGETGDANCEESKVWSLDYINKLEKRLQSLLYPQLDSTYSPPMKVLLNIGNLYIDMPVVIKSVSIPVSPESNFHWKTGMPKIKKITLEMRSSYPMWQVISASGVRKSTVGNKVFARKEYSSSNYVTS